MTSSRPKTPARDSHTVHMREVAQDRVPSRRGRRLQTQSDVNFYNTRETATPAHSPVDSDERVGSGSRMDATQTRRAARRENSMEDVNLNSYKPSSNSDLQPSRRNNNVAPLNKTFASKTNDNSDSGNIESDDVLRHIGGNHASWNPDTFARELIPSSQ